MKLFELPMVATSLVGLCCLAGPQAPPARADFTFGKPVDVDAAMQFFPQNDVCVSSFSSDNLEMFVFAGPGAGGQGGEDLWVLTRASAQEPWGPPENLGPLVNSGNNDLGASISADGLDLYFYSTRPRGYGESDLYVTRRATRTSPWGPPTNLGPKINSPYPEMGLSVSSDGLELYFESDRPGGYGLGDLYVSMRATTQDPWGDPVNLGPAVNATGPVYTQSPCLSSDGLLLVFEAWFRPGGFSNADLWMTRRASRSGPWEPAVNLGPTINGPSPALNSMPCLAPDGSALYFLWGYADRRNQPWKAPILPIVDFNGDGKVDLTDLVMLIDAWGTKNSPCDIGPMPWGDGKVDIEDLKVFMTYYEKENPPVQP